ncbi:MULTISPECIES: DsrE family protein [Roseateles]|jgi:hypothetical protein|uniref:DsrE family protein n=1 Tax=Roseateles TaxID=93681 RepID=UPI0014950B8A|nr:MULTISPECIES: DsrE family protein [Roseateles]MCV2419903.1 DsrE family protein [Paucibacter sp. DJ4R-1]MCV2437170.1 DsrE family protein [Paucibacter sp. DJ2R-2]WIV97285.1 DsrE family protein [Paucibacter aquatile]
MKAAIIILSDPKNGGEDALGRMFNGLAAAYDFKQRGTDVSIYFQGAGTRWPGVISQADHPVHALFKAVETEIAGVSCGCADVFGSREDAVKSGFDLITDNSVPGTSGLPSLGKLVADGFTVFTF